MRTPSAAVARALSILILLCCLGASHPSHAVEIQKVVADGIEAWLVEDHANPIIAVRIAFRGAGAAADSLELGGLARMAAGLLDEGAGELDSQAFQGRLDDLAIRLSFDVGPDHFGGSMETLSAHRDVAFELLRLAITQPRFDAEPVGRIRTQLQSQVRQDAQDPDAVANRLLWASLFPEHPYGRPIDGSEESLARITADDLRALVARRLARDRLVIGVVGDITPEHLRALLRSTFTDLPAHSSARPVAEVAARTSGSVETAEMDVPQSAVAFAQAGLKRDDPRFYALLVLNQILGGHGLTSRLFDEVRERRGLVYSVQTGPVALDHAGLLIGSAGTAHERVAETLSVIRQEWARIASSGVSDAELADSKAYLTGSFPLRFAGSSRLAGLLVTLQLDALGMDYLDRRKTLIDSVSKSEVDALARTLLAPDRLTFIVVGRPQGAVGAR